MSSIQQTKKNNCDISTISQGSKPRVEITSTNPIKSFQMVSETVLHPLTAKNPKEVSNKNSLQSNCKWSDKEKEGEDFQSETKARKLCPCQYRFHN